MELRSIPMRIGNAATPLGSCCDGPVYSPHHWFWRPQRHVDGVALCRMFHRAIRGHSLPKYLRSDHDPLYRLHQWEANLRILGVTEIKTVPYGPISHPFVERLIGTIRREYLDCILFWTTADLEAKLTDFQHYYNGHRTHAGLEGRLPEPPAGGAASPTGLGSYRWRRHCRGLYQTPIAA